MSESSSERKIDPAVVLVEHAEHGRGCHWRRLSIDERDECLPYRMAEAWAQEFAEHTALLEKTNKALADQDAAYAALEQAFMGLSDQYSKLVDLVAENAGRHWVKGSEA